MPHNYNLNYNRYNSNYSNNNPIMSLTSLQQKLQNRKSYKDNNININNNNNNSK